MKNLVLIGMAGVGKSSLGRVLAERLERDFLDTDDLIELQSKLKIPAIFSTYGEAYFRSLEAQLVEEICQDQGKIISTGGGIILNEDNICNLRKNGLIMYLEASIDRLVKNLQSSPLERPLLKGDDLYASVKRVYDARRDLYISSADYIINTNNKSMDEIVYEILEIYAKINY